jgi:hypothetical protein
MKSSVNATIISHVFYTGHCAIYVDSEVSVECIASIFRARDSVRFFKTLISNYQKTRCHSQKTKIRSLSTFEPTKAYKFQIPCQVFTAAAAAGTMEALGDGLSLDGSADVTMS